MDQPTNHMIKSIYYIIHQKNFLLLHKQHTFLKHNVNLYLDIAIKVFIQQFTKYNKLIIILVYHNQFAKIKYHHLLLSTSFEKSDNYLNIAIGKKVNKIMTK